MNSFSISTYNSGHYLLRIPIGGLGLLLLLGTLGCGGCRSSEEPAQRPGLERLHFSTFHFCGIGTDRRVWCAGGNQDGQLGDRTYQERHSLVQVYGLEEITGLAIGLFNTSCAWNEAGDLFCWGSNERYAIAQEDLRRIHQARPVTSLPPVKDVALGAYHGCALTKEQEVYCWGDNRRGQAAMGTEREVQTPTKVESLPAIQKLVSGGTHTCALDVHGTIHCWGSNDYGQLGLGSGQPLATRPELVGLVRGRASDLSASNNHTCGLFGENRVLYCWGNNQYGQLGLDDLDPRDAPTEIAEMAYVDELATGGGQVCVRIEETVYCAGEVLRPVEVARETGEGYLFYPSQALMQTQELWGGVLAICGPVHDFSIACRGIEHRALQ